MKVIRNEKGKPFSKWKPAEKFSWWFTHPEYPAFAPFIEACKMEYQFEASRLWRFDFAWPDQRVAVEVDGFGFGHQAQQRIADNNEKRNHAVSLGWRIFVYDSRLLGSKAAVHDAVDHVCKFLCGLGPRYEHNYLTY